MVKVSLDLFQFQTVCNNKSTTSVFDCLYNGDLTENIISNENVSDFMKGLGRMFYIVNREEISYKDPETVPPIFIQAWPYFVLFILLENILLYIERRPTMRLNDSITSVSHGLLQECGRILFRGGESYMYLYIYENYRLFDLKWNSSWTFYLAIIGVDFCYYWVHRACHEIHILWAQHQVHHSSEDFNMAVGLRQSVLQGWCAFIFYLPLALILPPAQFLTHQQFNLLYQFWIHTETVRNLGPLEWILNTPQHHRVHHGSNKYCLDKNYGGVFIIWDRLFGTYQDEVESEEIVYGIIVNEPSFNILHLQSFYTRHAIEKFNAMSGWRHKLAAIFYGPSWEPGTPRLGDEAEKFDTRGRKKYDVKISIWYKIYLIVHFSLVVYGFQELVARYVGMNPVTVFASVLYIVASVTIFGLFFERNPYACVFELVRCMILVTYIQRTTIPNIDENILLAAEVFFLLSGLFWCWRSFKVLEITVKTKTH